MVEAYWLIGKRIVEEVQQGEHRANYGDQVIKNISKALTAEFGKGFPNEYPSILAILSNVSQTLNSAVFYYGFFYYQTFGSVSGFVTLTSSPLGSITKRPFFKA